MKRTELWTFAQFALLSGKTSPPYHQGTLPYVLGEPPLLFKIPSCVTGTFADRNAIYSCTACIDAVLTLILT